MKKMITLVLGTMIAGTSFSQLSIGVHATGTYSSTQLKTTESIPLKQTRKITPGGGATVEYAFNKKFALRSGISYLQHSSDFKMEMPVTPGVPFTVNSSVTNKLQYLNVPIIGLYTKHIGNLSFYAGAGPYLNVGLKAESTLTAEFTTPQGSIKNKETIDLFKEDDQGNTGLKRIDYGVTALAGVRLHNGLFANVGYQLGLGNNVDEENDKLKTRGLQLTIGYFFKK